MKREEQLGTVGENLTSCSSASKVLNERFLAFRLRAQNSGIRCLAKYWLASFPHTLL
jgi:hypothetical protein